ncbi:MAG TPA: phosphate transport regulator, partial [Rubrivivax sp.]|nr:phosphate transport regulator [Rubrivivax sp.]
MEKQDAVASLGQTPLLQPARVRAALKANDRLKLYLSVLQAAAAHAAGPERAPLDLSREIAAADIAPREQAVWLRDLPAGASLQGDELQLPELPRLVARLREDLAAMARPVLDDVDTDPALAERVAQWLVWLAALGGGALPAASLTQLTQGRRERGDSLHLTIMDLHKALNRLAARLSGEDIDGA